MTKEDLLIFAYQQMAEVSEGTIDKNSLLPETVILNTGLDSLGYAQVMLSLEEYSNKKLDENSISWGEIKTIEQLVSLFL